MIRRPHCGQEILFISPLILFTLFNILSTVAVPGAEGVFHVCFLNSQMKGKKFHVILYELYM